MNGITITLESGQLKHVPLDSILTRKPNTKGERLCEPGDPVVAAFPAWPVNEAAFVVQHPDGRLEEVDASKAPKGRVIGLLPAEVSSVVCVDADGEISVAPRIRLSHSALTGRLLCSVLPLAEPAETMSLFVGLDCGTAFRTELPTATGRWRKLGPGKGTKLLWSFLVPTVDDTAEGHMYGSLRYYGSTTHFVVAVSRDGYGTRLVPSALRLQGSRVRGSRHGIPLDAVLAQATTGHDLLLATRNGRVLRVTHEFGQAQRRKLIDLDAGDWPVAVLTVPQGRRTPKRKASARERAARLRKTIAATCAGLDLESLQLVAALGEALPALGVPERERISKVLGL